ncbi:MAG: NodT family efflux transporter outer membrane factor (OMF) lipoprotein [Planctomycetota bacterium]
MTIGDPLNRHEFILQVHAQRINKFAKPPQSIAWARLAPFVLGFHHEPDTVCASGRLRVIKVLSSQSLWIWFCSDDDREEDPLKSLWHSEFEMRKSLAAQWRRSISVVMLIVVTSCVHPVRDLPKTEYENFAEHEESEQELTADWWRTFRTPQLNELITTALAENFTLRSAWDRLARAEAQAQLAGVDLRPKLSAEAGARPIQTGTGGLNAVNGNYNLGLFASYEIDLWGRIRAQSTASVLEVEASTEDVQAAAISLAAELTLRYFELTAFVAGESLLEQQKKANEDILKVLRAQFLNGDGRVADVLRQENLIEEVVGDLALVRRDIRLRATQISVLLGREPSAWSAGQLTTRELPELAPMPRTGLPTEVINRRPDVRATYLRIQSADQSFASALVDLYPRISLSSRGETRGTAADMFTNWLFNLAGNIMQPIFDGGQRNAGIERSRAELSEAINLYESASLAAISEVEAALIEEEHLRRFYRSLKIRTERAVKIFEQLRESYLNQQSAFIDVLAAQTTLQALQRDLIQTRLDLVSTRIALYRAAAGSPELTRPMLRDQELVPAKDGE